MTAKNTIDVTPSAIARRLLPDDASDNDRALIEAMAERALQLVPECKSSAGAFFFVERLMVSAASQFMKQHDIRCARVMAFLESLRNDPDETYGHDAEGVLAELDESGKE